MSGWQQNEEQAKNHCPAIEPRRSSRRRLLASDISEISPPASTLCNRRRATVSMATFRPTMIQPSAASLGGAVLSFCGGQVFHARRILPKPSSARSRSRKLRTISATGGLCGRSAVQYRLDHPAGVVIDATFAGKNTPTGRNLLGARPGIGRCELLGRLICLLQDVAQSTR